jgi:serine/threonine-protein kinase
VQGAAGSTAAPASAATSATSAAGPAGPSEQQLAEAADQLTQLSARADAVDASVGQIRSQQEASGVGMRSDVVSAMSRMNSYLESARQSLNASNLTAAQTAMARAEKEVDFLEGFLGKK